MKINIKIIYIFIAFCTFGFVENKPIHNEKYIEDFLSHYGYLEKGLLGPDRNRNENYLKDAISDFQYFSGINVTGMMDDETMKLMLMPRCGVKDKIIYRDVNEFRLGSGKWNRQSLTFAIVNYPNWLDQNTFISEITSAFNIWSKYTNLVFVRKHPSENVDIRVRFASYYHGDEFPFDGSGKVLGHAFYPDTSLAGEIHLDGSEDWTVSSPSGASVYQVVAHEIGHALGIDHSMYKSSLMTPYHNYNPAFRRNLSQDDIRAIQALYGAKRRTG